MKNRYGVDGVMIGSASIGYPWIFNEIKHYMKTGQQLPKPTMADRLTVCKMHLLKSIEWKGEKLGIIEMRRHYTNYFRGLPNFKEYRMKLVTNYSYTEILNILAEVEEVYANIDLDLIAA
jgi:tRNA-dihydrouridine synthase